MGISNKHKVFLASFDSFSTGPWPWQGQTYVDLQLQCNLNIFEAEKSWANSSAEVHFAFRSIWFASVWRIETDRPSPFGGSDVEKTGLYKLENMFHTGNSWISWWFLHVFRTCWVPCHFGRWINSFQSNGWPKNDRSHGSINTKPIITTLVV